MPFRWVNVALAISEEVKSKIGPQGKDEKQMENDLVKLGNL